MVQWVQRLATCNAKADEGRIDVSNVEVLNGERFIHPGVGEGQS